MRSVRLLALSAIVALLASPVFAQTGPNSQSMQGMQGMQGMGMHGTGDMGMKGMMGMHQMPATVTSVDINTGILDATSEGMKLRLHFPPTSLATVKAGDKVMLHLGFMKQ